MKRLTDSLLLSIVALVAVAVICFCGMLMEHGWFGYGAIDTSVSAIISVPSISLSNESELRAVDINKASSLQLQELPGIGNVIADRIVVYRTKNGDFTSVDDLLQVKGIGPVTLEKLKPFITVS